MKILFTNCYQAGNTGDVAIWVNLMRYLNEAFDDVTFLISSQTLLDWDVNQLTDYKVKFYVNRLKEAIQDADVVISNGGGYMIGDGMTAYLHLFKYAQDLNKPTFFSTQTFVGPINDETKELIKEVLNKAIVVSPREQGTYDLMIDAGVDKDKLEILPDTVFDIGIKEYDFPYPNSVKISIRGYDVSEEFLEQVALMADMIMETIGKVVFIPVGHGGNRNDTEIAIKIATYMKHEPIIIKDTLSAEELKSTLKDGILISDRYHGNLYAVSMGTPIVPISPDIDSKMPGLLELVNYPSKEIINKESFDAISAFDKVMNVWNKKEEYRKLLNEVIPKIKEDSAKVYNKIIDGIKNAGIK